MSGVLAGLLVSTAAHGETVDLFRPVGNDSAVPVSWTWHISAADACKSAIGGRVEGTAGVQVVAASYDLAAGVCRVIRDGGSNSTVNIATSSVECESGHVWRWEFQACTVDMVRQLYAIAFVLLMSMSIFAGWRLALAMV